MRRSRLISDRIISAEGKTATDQPQMEAIGPAIAATGPRSVSAAGPRLLKVPCRLPVSIGAVFHQTHTLVMKRLLSVRWISDAVVDYAFGALRGIDCVFPGRRVLGVEAPLLSFARNDHPGVIKCRVAAAGPSVPA